MSDGPTASSAGGHRPPRSRSPSRSPSPCASSAALCALLSAADPAPQQQQPLHFLSSMADHFPGLFQTGDFLSSLATQPNTAGAGQLLARNSTKTLKCPKCNWHYKYQETLEIHMKEKHADAEVLCMFCVENQAHPKLARGETYSCGYKPYRCELCKYSTTTKGNLSIHMQSDKHLHALQEIPQSLAAAAVGPSQLLLGQFGGGPQPSGNGHCEVAQSGATAASQPVAMRPELCGSLQCLICVNFSADSFAEMQAHLGREREQPQEGDMAALHGYFQCLLCPYSTNLKANFQLHTRTDKHVQRVQLINHLREGSAVLGVAEQFARLGSLKSAVQVRCQHCHEVFSCAPSLREHCLSRAHLVRTGRAYEGEEEEKEMLQQDEGQPLRQFVRSALVRCGLCAFQCARLDEAAEHANCTQHQPQSPPPHKDRCSPPETGSTEEQQRVQGWAELDAHLLAAGMAQRQPEPEQQAPRHSPSPGPKCPCADRAQLDRQEEHKIPAEVAQRVLIGDEQSTNRQQSACATGMASSALQSAIFPHRCAQCAIAFRSAEQLQAHSLAHSDAKFRLSHGCEQCPEPKCQFASRQALERHRAQAHGEGPPQAGGGAHFCDICADGERYESDQALMAHFNSEAHLHRAKGAQNGGQHLGPKSAAPSTSAASLPTRAGSKRNASAKALPYSCNVCSLHFGQPGTLDTHLRSVAHAQRMARLPELVRQGELDPAKAVFEQPEPHPPQRSIGEAAAERARAKSMGKLASSHQNTASPAAQQQVPSSSGPTPLDFKPGPDHQVAQLMAQMLAAAQQQSASPDPAQAAAAAATTFMAAQMAAAAQMASAASGGFGLLDMFGGFPSAMLAKPPQTADSFAEQQHSTGTFPSLLAAALAANGTANSDDLNNNCNEEETPPRAKRARTGSNGTPAQLQQRPQQQWSGLSSGGSREDSFASTPAPSLQQPPLDLASVLQALASGSAVPPLPFAAAGGQPPESGLLMAMAAAATQNPTPVAPQPNGTNNNAPPSPSPQKRARTRIADEQVKILRQYFDINNSPSEEQIKEMAAKAQLPEKVIKHWFRNTLFKERQRDKDSPYNFSIPPQMGIDLATYHRTGEARIIPVVKQEEQKREEGKRPTDAEEEEGPQKAEEEIEKGPEQRANTEEEEEEEEEEKAPEEVELEREQQQAEWEGHSEEQAAANSAAAAAAGLLASISKSAAATQQSFPFFGGASAAESFAMFSTLPFHPMLNGLSAAGAPSLAFNPFGASLPPHPQHHHQALNASNSYATSPSVPPSSSTGLPTTATMSSGRRANRTRFTDFQLRTLQQFFDKQAYPKDDDLEMLSNKMNLSPRVIVVWFQNARQKARKVFEQQPHHLQQLAQQQLEQQEQTQQRANFPCCRCDQVFQRYLELVQHQQRVCFAEEQKPEEESEERERGQRETTQELLRQLVAQHTTNAAQQQTEGRRHVPAKPFHKRCPFCGLLFQQRERLLEHIPQRHPEQMAPPDVDALPDAEEVPGMGSLLGGATAEPLDLSTSSSAMGNEYQKDADSWSHLGASVCASLSPAAFSCSAEENNADHSLSQSCSPFGALASASAAAALMPLFQAQQQLPQQRPHNQPSPGTLNSNSSKRFRTHLTPMQVFIMKSLFNDYKTPSMQECDSLGQKIGLHKRVVQVWFQNARAKERKAAGSGTGSGGESDDSSIPHCGPSAQQCHLCLVPFGPRLSLQEHIFSAEHIEKVRERGAQLRGIGTSGGSGDEAEAGQKSGEQQTKAEPDAEQSAAEAGAPEMAQLAQQFPYGLMYAAAASGFQTGPLPPLLYDPSLFGTPVPALKIPKSVMQLILADMAQRREHTRFTQDGLELAELASRVGEEDFRRASTVDLEVGWGCPQCGNVFQQPEQLQNHQKLICAGADGTFRLVQTHYQCGTCAERFGTQEEFRTHCLGDGHLQKRVKARNNSDD